MVADAHKKFASKAGKGKKGTGDEAEAEPFSVLHKVSCDAMTELSKRQQAKGSQSLMPTIRLPPTPAQ